MHKLNSIANTDSESCHSDFLPQNVFDLMNKSLVFGWILWYNYCTENETRRVRYDIPSMLSNADERG